MQRRFAFVGLVAALTVVGVLPSTAAPRSDSAGCPPTSARVLRVIDSVRIYRVGSTWSACRGRSGVRTRLTAGFDVLSGARAVAVRNNTIAYAYESYDDGLDGDTEYTNIGITTLGSGVPANSGPPGFPAATGPKGEFNTPSRQWNIEVGVSDIVVLRGRRAAWITCAPGDHYDRCRGGIRVIYLAPAPGRATPDLPPTAVARGAAIKSRSLRVSADGKTLLWTDRGEARSLAP